MRTFSTEQLVSNKQRLVDYFRERTGLPLDYVSQLYTEYQLEYGNDEQKILEAFNRLITDDQYTIENLINAIHSVFDKVPASEIHSSLLGLIDKPEIDDITLFQAIAYLLDLKNGVFSDNKLELTELFSLGIAANMNESIRPTIPGYNDFVDTNSNVEFYGGLKTILTKLNRRWGHNNHLVNVHALIDDYLSKEIEYLTNKQSIHKVDDTFVQDIFKGLFENNLNPMYTNIDNLRTFVSDLQALALDMVCFVNTYFVQRKQFNDFVSTHTVTRYNQALNQIVSAFYSSRFNSYLNTDKNKKDTFFAPIIDEFKFSNRYGYHSIVINGQSVQDCLYILKSLSNDFNMQLRPVISNFITYTFEMLNSFAKLDANRLVINKYKN